jgi:tRNA (cmo5U34)-methyltransferase
MRDEIFVQPIKKQFEFDESVASVFDDMLSRSIPYYKDSLKLLVDIISKLTNDNDTIYDLGCSTANTLIELYQINSNLNLIGVDNSTAMIERAKKKITALNMNIELITSDFMDIELSNSRVIIANYVMQFIRPLNREFFVNKIFNSLIDGGYFIFSEKVITDNKVLNKVMIDVYHNYKISQGYSNFEIVQKREALENILIPYTIDENIELLKRAGFNSYEILFKYNNFATFLAVK